MVTVTYFFFPSWISQVSECKWKYLRNFLIVKTNNTNSCKTMKSNNCQCFVWFKVWCLLEWCGLWHVCGALSQLAPPPQVITRTIGISTAYTVWALDHTNPLSKYYVRRTYHPDLLHHKPDKLFTKIMNFIRTVHFFVPFDDFYWR